MNQVDVHHLFRQVDTDKDEKIKFGELTVAKTDRVGLLGLMHTGRDARGEAN